MSDADRLIAKRSDTDLAALDRSLCLVSEVVAASEAYEAQFFRKPRWLIRLQRFLGIPRNC